ncbi:hypothetical protein OAO87_02540 [bacterium]|nr:hypothetical protein [bacterium]
MWGQQLTDSLSLVYRMCRYDAFSDPLPYALFTVSILKILGSITAQVGTDLN